MTTQELKQIYPQHHACVWQHQNSIGRLIARMCMCMHARMHASIRMHLRMHACINHCALLPETLNVLFERVDRDRDLWVDGLYEFVSHVSFG